MKSAIFIFSFLFCSIIVFSQNKVEDELKKLTMLETESYIKNDTLQWLATLAQDDKSFRSYGGNGFFNMQSGWKNFGPMILDYMRTNPPGKRPKRVEQDGYTFRISPAVAWMSYTQKIYFKDKDSLPYTNTLETRTLVKENGKWKIASICTVDSLSYATTEQAFVENQFNMSGYNFMAEKKYKQAIEIFKLNVTLYPDSWNAYDSLGEAYAADGNKELAIKNYERSIELNPKSESGPPALKKLKGE